MEAFAALGLAANVLQFVDFSWKLMSDTRQIYKSADGAAEESKFLRTIAQDIRDHDNVLAESTSTNPTLRKIIKDCNNISTELMEVTETLMLSEKSMWGSFVVALKGVWRQDKINTLSSRLERLQKRVTDHVSLMTLDGLSDLSKKITEIESASRNFGMEKQGELKSLKQEVVAAVQKLIKDESRKSLEKHLEQRRKTGEPIQPEMVENLSKDLQELRSALQSLQDRGTTTTSDQGLLKSLYFNGIKARHLKIEQAHTKTFRWIFDPDRSSQIRFDDWLQGNSDIFFIYGKPGCGKSTLMKFICHAKETEERLQRWAKPKKLVMAHYFFWNAGSTLQKSQEGLLRSLLFEILRKCRDLIPLAKETIGDVEDFESDEDRWTKDQLLRTYEMLVDHDLSTRFCFFIDGLDEYYDSNRKPEELIQTLRRLQSSSDIKLCASSRPWPAFTDAFGQTEWVLKVEDLTREDIVQYVADKFNEDEQYRRLSQLNSQYADLVQQVAVDANGVFLWVILVVRNLLDGFRNNDHVQLMRNRLENFPKDLEEFFEHMLNSIPTIYRKLTTRTFQTAASSHKPLLLLLYSFLDEMEISTDSMDQLTENTFSLSDIQSRQDQMRRQLYGRSQGLLEVVSDADEPKPFFQLRVDFLHRTVRDFLRDSPKVSGIFEASLQEESRNTGILVCHATVVQMRLAMSQKGLREDEMLEFVEDLFFFAHQTMQDQYRMTPFSTVEGLLEAGERMHNDAIFRYQWKMRSRGATFLALAAQYDFHSYMAKKLEKSNNRSSLNRHVGRPILDYALVPASGTDVIQYSNTMIELLLKSGAEPNRPYKGSTVWLRFLDALVARQIEADRMVIAKIIKALVANKATLDKGITATLNTVLLPDEMSIVLGSGKISRFLKNLFGS